MIPEIGLIALVLAGVLALCQATLPFWGAAMRDPALMKQANYLALTQFLFVALSYLVLTYAHISDDFSVRNVFENSHALKPLLYKISGVWGNHEGSMLLWVLILSLFGAFLTLFGRSIPPVLKANILGVQGLISLAFLAFILFTSNPFERLFEVPLEGRDLNPILQDPGLAIHPPLLYLGYVGFSLVFSFAAAALIDGSMDAAWAKWVRPWILLSWIFLTLGIAMGSYWAYYTLGWGGFWFWDPVENASLMPWLAGTALLHSVIVMEKRNALKIWTVFLSILAFSLSLLGTFLVRSGVLTSVHSFASDPTRGLFILAILVVFIGGALTLYAWRAPALKQGSLFAPVSREGALVLNNLFLVTSCATVLVGTLYPLGLEAATGAKITVGAPFFNLCVGLLMIPIMLGLPFGQALSWKRGNFLGAFQRLLAAIGAGLLVLIYCSAILNGGSVLAPIAAGIAIFIVIGSFVEIIQRATAGGLILEKIWSRLSGLPLSAWGTALAHMGFGITLLGLAASGWGVEVVAAMKKNEIQQVGPYEVVMQNLASREGSNYSEIYATLSLRASGLERARIEPAKRNFATRSMATSKAGIATLGLSQIYASMSDANADGSVNMHLYWKPLVVLIWLGALIMAFGAALSITEIQMRRISRARNPGINAAIKALQP